MCEPTTILMAASLAASVIGTGVQMENGRKTASQQGDAVRQANDQQQMDAVRQQSQIAAQGADEMNQAARTAQADMASLDAIAGEYGGGQTVDRARAVMGLQSSEGLATIAGNAKAGINESAASAYAANARSISQRKAIQRPSLAAAGLKIAGDGLNAYDRYRTINNKSVK